MKKNKMIQSLSALHQATSEFPVTAMFEFFLVLEMKTFVSLWRVLRPPLSICCHTDTSSSLTENCSLRHQGVFFSTSYPGCATLSLWRKRSADFSLTKNRAVCFKQQWFTDRPPEAWRCDTDGGEILVHSIRPRLQSLYAKDIKLNKKYKNEPKSPLYRNKGWMIWEDENSNWFFDKYSSFYLYNLHSLYLI